VGDTVRLISLNIRGTVVSLDGDDAVVQAGALRTRVSQDDLELVYHGPAPALASDTAPGRKPPLCGAPSPGIQIDLARAHGRRRPRKAGTVSGRRGDGGAALGAHRPRQGTGKLRQEVQRFIGAHPLVVSYETAARNEGGDGAPSFI
jgi:hypothetical protein